MKSEEGMEEDLETIAELALAACCLCRDISKGTPALSG